MESKLYAVVLVIFAVVGLGNCVPDVQELTKTIENMQKKMQTYFLHLESENRKIRKELDKQNNRTTDLETKFESALSSFLATADNVSKGLGRCAAVNSELRKLNSRINKKINRLQRNINHLEENIADLESENQQLRKQLEGEKNRTSELDKKMNSASSRGSPDITDTESRDSTVHQKLQKNGDMINLLASDFEHLRNKSQKSTNQLQETVRKALKDEKALIQRFNKTLHHKQEEATKEVRNIREALQEITTKLNNTVAAMADMSIRISPNERLLSAITDCGSHKVIPYGDVYGDSFVGGTPVISCDSGYSQTGSAQCKLPVFWETDVKCQKDCATLHVSHGMVIPDTSVPHGTTVTVTCDSDYRIVGNSTAVCNNGVFTDVPACKRRTLTDMVVASSSNYTVKVEDDSDTPGIAGMEFLSNGQLVLCDYWNNRMKLLSSDFRMLDSLELQSQPWDVSAVNTTTVLITLPLSRQLQYIHVMSKFQPSSQIQLDKECWGIDVVGDEIFTSCHNNPGQGEIRVLNMEGTLKRRLGVSHGNSYMFRAPDYLTVNPDTGYIYVSDWDTDNVTCLSSAGDIVYRYGDQELNNPDGIYVDHFGTVIVCGRSSRNVHVITASGKKHRVLLTLSDGLWWPQSVAYREGNATFVIGSFASDNLLVFKLENNF